MYSFFLTISNKTRAETTAPAGYLTISNISVKTLAEGSDGLGWMGRAAIKKLTGGIVVLIYREGVTHSETTGGKLHIKFSPNYGSTWTAEDTDLQGNAVSGFPMQPPEALAGEGPGEPWIYIAPNGNLILHFWQIDYNVSGGGTWQSISSDHGKTWSTPTQVIFADATNNDYVFTTDDDFVLNGIIYAATRERKNINPALEGEKNIFIKSTDNGETWEYVAEITDWVNYPTKEVGLEYVGNNTVVALLKAVDNDFTYYSKSTDLGETWSAISDITGTVGVTARHRIYTRSRLKGAWNYYDDPVLFAVCYENQDPPNSPGRRNCLLYSKDKGDTWIGPVYLDVEYNDGGYGDMFYNPITDEYVVITYRGTLLDSDLVQYNFKITWE